MGSVQRSHLARVDSEADVIEHQALRRGWIAELDVSKFDSEPSGVAVLVGIGQIQAGEALVKVDLGLLVDDGEDGLASACSVTQAAAAQSKMRPV